MPTFPIDPLTYFNFRLTATLSDLNEERQLGKALRNNQQQWQTKLAKLEEKFNELKQTKEKEISDLKEQVRDLMFFIEAQRVNRFSYAYFTRTWSRRKKIVNYKN